MGHFQMVDPLNLMLECGLLILKPSGWWPNISFKLILAHNAGFKKILFNTTMLWDHVISMVGLFYHPGIIFAKTFQVVPGWGVVSDSVDSGWRRVRRPIGGR